VQLQVETLLPAQWYGRGIPDASLVAEKRPLLAVLEEMGGVKVPAGRGITPLGVT
jgi:hypothetical protein